VYSALHVTNALLEPIAHFLMIRHGMARGEPDAVAIGLIAPSMFAGRSMLRPYEENYFGISRVQHARASPCGKQRR
jgi:hypothetical protein